MMGRYPQVRQQEVQRPRQHVMGKQGKGNPLEENASGEFSQARPRRLDGPGIAVAPEQLGLGEGPQQRFCVAPAPHGAIGQQRRALGHATQHLVHQHREMLVSAGGGNGERCHGIERGDVRVHGILSVHCFARLERLGCEKPSL